METARAENRKRPDEIEKDLKKTRAEMDETMRAIEEKVAPGEWIDQTARYLIGSVYEYAGYFGRGIKKNPLPLALAGIGISWLVLAGRRGSTSSELQERGRP